MKRRHRRVLFNVFAFMLLITAIDLNMFHLHKNAYAPQTAQSITAKTREAVKTNTALKLSGKEIVTPQP